MRRHHLQILANERETSERVGRRGRDGSPKGEKLEEGRGQDRVDVGDAARERGM
jgi:hypothetical protein